MPIVEVTYAPQVSDAALDELAQQLPHLVSVAVACDAEPYDLDLQPGDVELRFRELGPRDRSDLDAVIEVRSKWYADRAENRQQRAEDLHAAIGEHTELRNFGVYLVLPVAAWAQSE